MAEIAPSVLAADFSKLSEEIANADSAGAKLFHLDIMDGHFVPNISFGPGIVKTINELTESFLDVHLMITKPEKYFKQFIEAGADLITFHLEVHPQPEKYVIQLHEMGIQAGISISPDTAVERVLPFIELFDMLLIMSVYPGFGGQKFIPATMDKIKIASEYINKNSLKTKIEVDGGVNLSNATRLIETGTDILVMGSAFFGADNKQEVIRHVNSKAGKR